MSAADAGKSKRVRFAGSTTAVAGVADLLSDQDASSEGVLESLPIERIVLDPEQPRRLHLDRTDPSRIAEDDPGRDTKLTELEALRELASSIETHGLIQPIGVYAHGPHYRVVWGERRVLASVLLGQARVLARILPQRPARLRSMQLVENVARRDLSLADRVDAVVALVRESGITRAEDLAGHIGWGRSQAHVYWSLAVGPEDVRTAIRNGVVRDAKEAAAIAAIDTKEGRMMAIAGIDDVSAVPSAPSVPIAPVRPQRAPSRGRPRTKIAISTGSVSVGRYIVERLMEPEELARFADADWDDFSVVTDILRQCVKRIEKQHGKNE